MWPFRSKPKIEPEPKLEDYDAQEVDVRVLMLNDEVLTSVRTGELPSTDDVWSRESLSYLRKAPRWTHRLVRIWHEQGRVWLRDLGIYIPWNQVKLITVSEPRPHIVQVRVRD